MKSYGKRFLKQSMLRQIQKKTESRDAVIHSIDTSNRWTGVKVQGSSKVLRAYWPENWEQTPYWLKIGQAVRISHTGGNRARIELVGLGQYRPTPISGDSDPTIPGGADAILSGLNVIEVPNGTWMRIMVTVGTVRFDGTTYTVSPVAMGNTNFVMGMGGKMGQIAYVSGNIAAPSAGTYRYDLLVIGSDLIIDIVTGTASAMPELPDVPSDHLLCGWVLLYPGMTDITTPDINPTVTAPPYASQVSIAIADDDLAWAESGTNITVSVLDQYGNAIYREGTGWYIGLTISYGSGTLTFPECEYLCPEDVSLYSHTWSANSMLFYYNRAYVDEHSPILVATVEEVAVYATDNIILRDSSGDPIY